MRKIQKLWKGDRHSEYQKGAKSIYKKKELFSAQPMDISLDHAAFLNKRYFLV